MRPIVSSINSPTNLNYGSKEKKIILNNFKYTLYKNRNDFIELVKDTNIL